MTLLPLTTTYRAQFADGSRLDVHADPDAFAAEVAALCGPAEAAALRRYLVDLAELYRLQLRTFIDRNLDSPLDLLGPELVALARRGGFGRLSRHVARYFADDRLRRLFSFQALYAGVSPFRAIAAYAVIAQLDIGAGVWHPVGGIAAVPVRWPPPRPTQASGSATDVESPDLEVGGTRVTGGPARRRRAAARRRRRRHHRPAAHPRPRPARPAAAGLLAVLRGAAPRACATSCRAGAPHDQLRRRLARRVRRAHPRRAGR